MDRESRRHFRWIVIGVAALVITAFMLSTAGVAQNIWRGIGALVLLICVLVLLDIHTITWNLWKERKEKKIARQNWVFAESMKMSVHEHGAPEVQFIAELGLPYAPMAGGNLMHPGADVFQASVDILGSDDSVIATCQSAKNWSGTMVANYPQDFPAAPQRLEAGIYKARWTNLALSTVIGEKSFEIDKSWKVMQSKALRRAVKKMTRRTRLRTLAERDT